MTCARGVRGWLVVFAVLFALAWVLAGCELVADFDRDKIPEPERDAATFPDADVMIPDAATPDDDGGSVPPPDEDAGR